MNRVMSRGQSPQLETTERRVRRSNRERQPSTRYPVVDYILLTNEGELESYQEAKNHEDKDE